MNYYNEIDPGAAAWLRELMYRGEIPAGIVDTRSILDVHHSDLAGFTQCHFFAGIGGWSLALRLAGVPSTQPLWTGSPPCQPFSVAGRGRGKDDERHLAPAFLDLVAECRPAMLFGEQVRAAVTKDHWLDALLLELEEYGYTCGTEVLPAAGFDAPHKRDRIFFGGMADSCSLGSFGWWVRKERDGEDARREEAFRPLEVDILEGFRAACELANGIGDGLERGIPGGTGTQREDLAGQTGRGGAANHMAISLRPERGGQPDTRPVKGNRPAKGRKAAKPAGHSLPLYTSPHYSYWGGADWILCRDGCFRPVEPGTFPLANGVPARVGRLRGYGNAIVPPVAAGFIRGFMDAAVETARGDI